MKFNDIIYEVMTNNGKLNRVLSFVIFILVMSSAAIVNNGRIAGCEINSKNQANIVNDTITQNSDGSMIVNTSLIGKGIIGYSGPVPLRIYK